MSTDPVTSATGMPAPRIRASSSCVCSPRRCTSSSTTSGRSSAIASSAASTVAASRTVKPSSSRLTRQRRRSAASSSTMSAVGAGSCMGRESSCSIGLVGPRAGTQDRYAVQVGELWSWLSPTMTRVDELDDVESLRRLQYALHLAGEHAYGLEPPEGSASAHAELADALAGARDLTGEIAAGSELFGSDGVAPLLHEWRGALFRVRLARMRLATPDGLRPAEPEADDGIVRPLAAFLLALGGALAFVAGATIGLWPLWTLGLVGVCASILASRP